VPYKGTGPAINDLLGGNISAVCEGVGGAAGHVRSGPLRGIATATLKRAQALPDLPTVNETGLPGFEAYTWNMFFAPAKTPREIVEKLNRDINRAAKDPTLRPRLDALGVEVVDDSTPQSLKDFVSKEIVRWTAVVKSAGVKVE
jgi:tripartite-type tricarboxylate transporter receptor subunit TctC